MNTSTSPEGKFALNSMSMISLLRLSHTLLVSSKNQSLIIFFFSGHDYTSTYGATPFDGNLTPSIANCFKPGVTSCILDGEMVGYNPETKTLGKVSIFLSNFLMQFGVEKFVTSTGFCILIVCRFQG